MRFEVILTSLALVSCADMPIVPLDMPKFAAVVNDSMQMVVMLANVSIIDEEPVIMGGYCGGVIVSEHLILTAHHCVDERMHVYYTTRADWPNHPPSEAVVEATDPKFDLAIMRTTESFERWADIESPPLTGAPVFTVNHGEGNYWQVMPGVSLYPELLNLIGIRKKFAASILVKGGASGGGLFSYDGKLVGVVSDKTESVKSYYAPALRGKEWIR